MSRETASSVVRPNVRSRGLATLVEAQVVPIAERQQVASVDGEPVKIGSRRKEKTGRQVEAITSPVRALAGSKDVAPEAPLRMPSDTRDPRRAILRPRENQLLDSRERLEALRVAEKKRRCLILATLRHRIAKHRQGYTRVERNERRVARTVV